MSAATDALNRLTKWRTVLAGWQLGTRSDTDAECQAVRDHREATLILRAEVSAIIDLLVAKGVCTRAELEAAIVESADFYSDSYARKFPGFTATDNGLSMDPTKAADTMRGWRP